MCIRDRANTRSVRIKLLIVAMDSIADMALTPVVEVDLGPRHLGPARFPQDPRLAQNPLSRKRIVQASTWHPSVWCFSILVHRLAIQHAFTDFGPRAVCADLPD